MVPPEGGVRWGESGHGGPPEGERLRWGSRVRALGLSFAIGWSLAAGGLPAEAQAQAQAQAQVQPAQAAACSAVLEGALEDELLARIRGQSQDVSCALLVGEPRAAADAVLAIAHAADSGYSLTVRVRADGSKHVRTVPAAPGDTGDALARSATFEALALVVRGELVELARAAEARRAEAHARRAAAVATKPVAANAKPADRDDDAASEEDDGRDDGDDPAQRDSSWRTSSAALAVGWQLAALGVSEAAHALTGRFVLTLGAIDVGVAGALGFSAELEDDYVRAAILRHALLAVAALPLLRSDRLRVELGMNVGLLWFARELVELRDPALVATADSTALSFAAGAEAALEVRVLGPLGLRAALGADAVPAAPRYVYALAGARRQGAGPWYLQPRGGVGLVLRLP